jgi:uncharacterized membrane protein YqaE (UPF0057 family)
MDDLIQLLLIVLLPPLGVFLMKGIGKDFWINLVLTILWYVPGLVHGLWLYTK